MNPNFNLRNLLMKTAGSSVLAAILVGCSQFAEAQQPAGNLATIPGAGSTLTTSSGDGQYRIGTGDVLKVEVFN